MVFKSIQEDISAFMARDPAARSKLEIVLCYPGFHALVLYRLSSALWRRRFYLLGRFVSHLGRLLTGIEIHPGAKIGKRLVIDHGFGVVIGETSEIGEDVTLYQGVTLGGIAPSVNSQSQVNVKRHPTLKNGVIVGSGGQILGPITVGEGARVGANAVVTKDLAPGVTAVGIPAHGVLPKDRTAAGQFVAYGTPAEGCPDPVLATIENMRGQIAALQDRVHHLEKAEHGTADGDAAGADWAEWRDNEIHEVKVASMGESGRRS
ncbi:MAG: serine O-acetyltransferase [Rhodospirillales bacterium]|nr:serine O-acetyltransferase [Rhodospirillales bacterium]